MTTATLKTIAAQLQISMSTVSRVLNGKGKQYRISEATIERIQKEADRVGFAPNQIASALRLKKTNTIALVLPDISNNYFSSIARSLTIEAGKLGYSILLCDSLGDVKIEKEEIRLLKSRSVDGMIISPCSAESEHLLQVKNSGIPIVLFDRYVDDAPISSICSDNFQGAFDAVTHLLENGHQHIGCLQGSLDTTSAIERLSGYQTALKEYQQTVNADYVQGNDFSFDCGYQATKTLLENNPEITALFSMSNVHTFGALTALKELNKEVYQDISIVTFDDDPVYEILATPLTAIAQPKALIGIETMKTLYQQISGNKDNVSKISLATSLIKRASVKNLNL